MVSKPRLEQRSAQPYAGIRTQVPMRTLEKASSRLFAELKAWMHRNALQPAGAPFLRFHVINMDANMDVTMGVPMAAPISNDGHIQAGCLPAGRYASLIYTGARNAIKGNKALLDWAAKQGLVWDRWEDESGDAFGARFESYLTDPARQPDRSKWQIEVAIRLADDPPGPAVLRPGPTAPPA